MAVLHRVGRNGIVDDRSCGGPRQTDDEQMGWEFPAREAPALNSKVSRCVRRLGDRAHKDCEPRQPVRRRKRKSSGRIIGTTWDFAREARVMHEMHRVPSGATNTHLLKL
jgi:hypothetical protein